MPNWLRALPVWLRGVIVVSIVLLAATPGLFAPGIAESYGLSRSTGSTIGGLISLVLFLFCYLMFTRMAHHEARREVVQEMDRLLEPYRDDEGQDQDQDPKEPEQGREVSSPLSRWTKLLLVVLVFLPAVPAWIGTTFPQAFGSDLETVQAASALLSVMLFIGSLTVGWQIYQHHRDEHDGDGDEPPAQG